MYEWIMLGVGLVLTVGTGLFVASEFALVNLDRNDLESRQRGGEKRLAPTIACQVRSWASRSPPCSPVTRLSRPSAPC
jgi:CBS domain containing-hemolysin-like protein